jgi:hypothetical protein
MDITTLTSQGITPFQAEWVEYETNLRNAFKYRIKYLRHSFDAENKKMAAFFRVERFIGEVKDIAWTHEAICVNETKVDKDGNIITELVVGEEGNQSMNPLIWGGEFDRMAVLFSAPVPNSTLVGYYINKLFTDGTLDSPKNKNI